MGMQIEQIAPFNNMAVITPPNRMPQKPITIAPGEVKMLNLVEMKTLFNHLNYTTDVSVRGNIDEGLLEEGTYEARLTAYKSFLLSSITQRQSTGENAITSFSISVMIYHHSQQPHCP